jgi:hypothetical protein
VKKATKFLVSLGCVFQIINILLFLLELTGLLDSGRLSRYLVFGSLFLFLSAAILSIINYKAFAQEWTSYTARFQHLVTLFSVCLRVGIVILLCGLLINLMHWPNDGATIFFGVAIGAVSYAGLLILFNAKENYLNEVG